MSPTFISVEVVNALSTSLDVQVRREGDTNVYGMDFKLGKVDHVMEVVGFLTLDGPSCLGYRPGSHVHYL